MGEAQVETLAAKGVRLGINNQNFSFARSADFLQKKSLCGT
jgi:hypothetical protein